MLLAGVGSYEPSRRARAFYAENSPGLIKNLGLVGAISQLRHFLASKHVTGVGRTKIRNCQSGAICVTSADDAERFVVAYRSVFMSVPFGLGKL